MPGRDYNKAYALFEQSLGDTSYPVYPKANPHNYRLPVSCDVPSRSFAERSRLTEQDSSRTESSRVETHLLPPTPPPGTQTQDPSFGLANRLATPELTPDTRHGTPFTSLEAPTPNTTPPSLGTPKAFRGVGYDSSRAESFQTAQEDVSEGSSPIELPLQGTKKSDIYPTSRMEAYALGLQNFDRVTERAHRRFLGDSDLKRPSKEDVDLQSSTRTESSESRPKRRKLDKIPRELTFLEDAGHTSLKSPTNQESPSSWLDGSSTGENSPVDQKPMDLDTTQSRRFSTPESKILTPSSAGSPVVEASIVDSPPHRRRQLRHISKTAELRRTSRSLPTVSSLDVSPEQRAGSPHARAQPSDDQTRDPPPPDSTPAHTSQALARSRTALTSKMPKSLRSKPHPWRRSAPGLLAPHPSATVPRNAMGVVPEDSPLPESPQPAPLGEGPARRSSEHSTAASDNPTNRPPTDQFLDPASARNTFTRSSPVSDASEALVRDATTVNIFPHNNDSLIVIEHAPKEAHPSTPDATARKVVGVESPLTNPRRPPDPPSVSVVPPTPASTEDLHLVSTKSSQTVPLASSFSQRAKRYSDSLATSVSKLTKQDPKRSSLPTRAASDSQILSESLHPGWRPRPPSSHLNDSGAETSATENIPPPTASSTASKSGRRLSVRRLLSIRRKSDEEPGALREIGGFAGSLRRKLQERHSRKEEERLRERRDALRGRIGGRFYVDR